MSFQSRPLLGVQIAGSGAAFPLDIPNSAAAHGRVINRDFYRHFLGVHYEAELERRGWSLRHPELTHGIHERQWLHPAGTAPRDACPDAGDLALSAAHRALLDAQVLATELEAVIVATSTPPRITNSLASRVCNALGTDAAAFDVRAGGAGGLCAWLSGLGLVVQGASTVLVVATEATSFYLDSQDLGTAALYGDAAAALILKAAPSSKTGCLFARSGTESARGRAFTVPGLLPPTDSRLHSRQYLFQRSDKAYGAELASVWERVLGELAIQPDWASSKRRLFFPYAITSSQVTAASRALGVSDDDTLHTLAHHGCIGVAGPMVALDAARRQPRGITGTTLALAAVGGGISWATLLWQA